LIAGPGALASITILMRQVQGTITLQIGVIGALIAVLSILYICLSFSHPLSKLIGVTGANVMSRVFGIILAALAVQLIIEGVQMVLSQKF